MYNALGRDTTLVELRSKLEAEGFKSDGAKKEQFKPRREVLRCSGFES